MSKEAQLTTGEARQLRGLAGQLNWTSSQTRPDMSFGACEIGTSIKDATISDLIHANKNIRRLKAGQVSLQFPNLGNIEECMIACYSDATFANLRNASSQGGYMFLFKYEKKFGPISWKSKKIQRVVKSTLAAQTLALVEALEACFMISAILLEIYKKQPHSKTFPIHCFTESKSLLDSVHPTKSLKEKRLKVYVCIIRDMLEKNEISSINWYASEKQLADCLRKAASSPNKLISVLKRDSGLSKFT